MFVEYAGLTQEASSLIERFRKTPDETKSDIVVRILSDLPPETKSILSKTLDLGQGAQLNVGEKPILFLSEDAKRSRKQDAVAEVREDGFYMDGKKVPGSFLQAAMRTVQERKNHRNSRGQIISRSAWRQWCVVRDGKIYSMLELKDPSLARRQGRTMASSLPSLEELGLLDDGGSS